MVAQTLDETQRVLSPGRVARLIARVRRAGLDHALAAGEDPLASPQLAVRAATLTAAGTRTMIAGQIDDLLQAAEHPRGNWVVRPQRGSVLANAQALGDAATLLRETPLLRARGIAMLSELLHDGAGPVYLGDATRLARRLDAASAAMRLA